MYDPVNRLPDEDPPTAPHLTDRQKSILTRKHCSALLKSIEDARQGMPWWQNTPVTFCFSDSVVRDRLLKLMKSETVRLTDRNYMLTLSNRLVEAHCDLESNRIDARRNWEIEREKNLIFEGKFSLADGPPGFYKHPFFREDHTIKKLLATEKRRKKEKSSKKPPQVPPSLAYPAHTKLQPIKPDDEPAAEGTELPNLDKSEFRERGNVEDTIEKETRDKIIQPPIYHEHHYEALGVRQLKRALTVEKMYKYADRIFLKLHP